MSAAHGSGVFPPGCPLPVDGDGLEQAACALLERTKVLRLGPPAGRQPWSLAELGFTAEDDRYLDAACEALSRDSMESWVYDTQTFLCSFPDVCRRDALGLVLFAACAQAARRDAQGNEIWPFVRLRADGTSRFSRLAADFLFTQGQPSSALKYALEAAAVRFRLRHVFDWPDTKRYMVSVHLQAGLSLPGAREHLHDWLDGASAPVALRLLLRGDALRCARMLELFRALWEFRRKVIDSATALQQVALSPYLPPGVPPATLLTWAARNRERSLLGAENLPWGRREAAAAIAPDAVAAFRSGEATTEPLLCGPFLIWTPPATGGPRFVAELSAGVDETLDAPRYGVRVGGVTAATLLRQANGRYRVFSRADGIGERATLALSGERPEEAVALIDERTESVAWSQTLASWVPDDDVNVWPLSRAGSGERPAERLRDAWERSLTPGRPYALLLAEGLELRAGADGHPYDALHRFTRPGVGTFHLLPSDWPDDLAVWWDGGPYWHAIAPGGGAASQNAPPPAWEEQVKVNYVPYPVNTSAAKWLPVKVCVRVTTPKGYPARYLRAGGRALPRFIGGTGQSCGGDVLFGPIPVESLDARLTVRVGIDLTASAAGEPEGEAVPGMRRMRREITRVLHLGDLPGAGALRLTPKGWRRLVGSARELSVAEAREQPVRLFPPNAWRAASAGEADAVLVMQGERIVGRRAVAFRGGYRTDPEGDGAGAQSGTRLLLGARQQQPLGVFAGWGRGVHVARPPAVGQPSCHGPEDSVPLVGSIYDSGILTSVVFEDGDDRHRRRLTMIVRRPLEPDARLALLLVGRDGVADTVPGARLASAMDGGAARLTLSGIPADASEPLFVALAYEGARLGAWWADDWAQCVASQWPARPETFALLRWLRPPLLCEDALPGLREFAARNAPEALAGWLRGTGLSGTGLRLAAEDGIEDVAAALLAETPEAVHYCVRAFGDQILASLASGREVAAAPLPAGCDAAAAALCGVSPPLAAAVLLRAARKSLDEGAGGRDAVRRALLGVAARGAGIDTGTGTPPAEIDAALAQFFRDELAAAHRRVGGPFAALGDPFAAIHSGNVPGSTDAFLARLCHAATATPQARALLASVPSLRRALLWESLRVARATL